MSDNDNEKVSTIELDPNDLLNAALESYYQQWYDPVEKLGVPREIARRFICLRHHANHAWGICPVMVNGESSIALVSPMPEDGKAKIEFILPTASMQMRGPKGEVPENGIIDIKDLTPAEKQQLN